MTSTDDLPWRAGPRVGLLDRLVSYLLAPPERDGPRPAEAGNPGAAAADAAVSGFVPPSPPARPARVGSAEAALRAAVVGRPEHVSAAATLLAGALSRRAGARAGAVLVWSPQEDGLPPLDLPSVSAARDVARRLAAGGLRAESRGALARAALPGSSTAALAALDCAAAALPDVPLVLALAGPRTLEWEEVLARQDVLAVVAATDEDPALASLARAGLPEGPRVLELRPPTAPSRLLAATGIPPWGRPRGGAPAR